jgi:amino acid transporter
MGRPLASADLEHQRLRKPVALAVFSSDAISSVAYASEEILLGLAVAGAGFLHLATPIGYAIIGLMIIVAISYRQTIKAYPNGGGSYIVAKENLGVGAGLVAGGSLLTDYILTVAVSVSAGTAAITSALPGLYPERVPIAVALVLLLALANLRGVRESGAMLAWPTYLFIGTLGTLVVVGLARYAFGGSIHVASVPPSAAMQGITWFIVLRAFASGCSAMTGVEAIANGVQAFKAPEARNARITLTWMAGILVALFLGVNTLAVLAGVHPAQETVVSQLARGTFGTGWFYFVLQTATAMILVLAANTSYADFPRLGSFMAGDGYMPKQLKDRGFRLVHSNGIIVLTGMSIVLIVAFQSSTNRLIPLYALGVFTAFTLSQSGMVVHWLRTRETGWHWSVVVNGVGAVITSVVLVVIITAKFGEGAWIVTLLIPALVAYFLWVKRHYDRVACRLRLERDQRSKMDWQSFKRLHNHIVLLISDIDMRLVRAVQYARGLKGDSMEAVFVDVTGDKAEDMRRRWNECDFGIRLTVIDSPYREIIRPIQDYIHSIPRPTDDHVITVILPEFVPDDAVGWALHDQTAFFIKSTLFRENGVIVTDVPYHLKADPAASGQCAAG